LIIDTGITHHPGWGRVPRLYSLISRSGGLVSWGLLCRPTSLIMGRTSRQKEYGVYYTEHAALLVGKIALFFMNVAVVPAFQKAALMRPKALCCDFCLTFPAWLRRTSAGYAVLARRHAVAGVSWVWHLRDLSRYFRLFPLRDKRNHLAGQSSSVLLPFC